MTLSPSQSPGLAAPGTHNEHLSTRLMDTPMFDADHEITTRAHEDKAGYLHDAQLYVDFEKGTCRIEYEHPDETAMPDRVWRGHADAIQIDPRVSAIDVQAYLASARAQRLLDEVVEGYEKQFDEAHDELSGHLTGAARSALDQLGEDLGSDEYVEQRAWRRESCRTWLDAEELDITAETTNAELHRIADDLREEALAQHLVLTDIMSTLAEHRGDIRRQKKFA